jgi:hypothetical protein
MDVILLEIEKQMKKCGITQFVAIIDSAELTFGKITHYESKWVKNEVISR